jgi:hypothetical protein
VDVVADHPAALGSALEKTSRSKTISRQITEQRRLTNLTKLLSTWSDGSYTLYYRAPSLMVEIFRLPLTLKPVLENPVVEPIFRCVATIFVHNEDVPHGSFPNDRPS